MFRDVFIHNSLGVIFMLLAIVALVVNFYMVRFSKKNYIVIGCLLSLLLWSCIIILIGDYLSFLIDGFHIKYLSRTVVRILSILLIVTVFIRKAFIVIDYLERRQVSKGRDVTDSRVISKVLKIIVLLISLLVFGQQVGMSFSGLLAFGGIGGIAVGMAGKDILSNFFSGVMLYFERPFNIGDWIRSPDRNIEGVVAEIGWRLTKVITFENRPMYIPNSLFSDISLENPGRMTNRRIKTTIGLRYEDSKKISLIVEDIRNYLMHEESIDQRQTLLVYFNEFGDSSLNIMVYCFTYTRDWEEWLDIQQKVYLRIVDIVHNHKADFAYPSTTLYFSSN
ncbi:TPA: mechanosensitive ion channel family protein [Escherichia coli]|uniref:mechanosensitive ion channel family protein n=1 Tax=Escherichia coli TaxID=562 RepID=UPI000BE97A31|nr:mechanosensitive ion channel family protein [Escherichia coli]HAX4967945.1 mechanosensitive ion channel family protein [Escherichia coli]HAX4986728.1 mechanosensitive ion channel family protein [Escherichia coli]HAX4991532.1 mechanosensitive ion channel family protein [Escherichia coli]HBE5694457.1 mechanosensitive ion channel family protein [Escherichia coli]